MLSLYQSIPYHIDPVALSIGSFSVRWYSLMWLAGIVTVYQLLKHRIENGKKGDFQFSVDDLQNLFFCLIPGVLLGGRLGYVLFYDLAYYLQNVGEIFFPVKITEAGMQFVGYYGMSFYGGFLGAILAGAFFVRKKRIDFWKLADFFILFVPVGYFFGRLGNFLNGELYGRATDASWGMYFPSGGFVLRHPSQLYEAFFEGAVLFVILFVLNQLLENRKMRACNFPGMIFLAYVFGYSFFRFFLEFFREPDIQAELFFGILTQGQLLAVIAMAMSAGLCAYFQYKHKNAIILK